MVFVKHSKDGMRPAGDRFVLLSIEKLQARYFQVDQPDRLAKVLAEEWYEDMEQYPRDLIEKACRLWRNSAKAYAPKSAGQLMESIKLEWIDRQANARKAQDILRIIRGVER